MRARMVIAGVAIVGAAALLLTACNGGGDDARTEKVTLGSALGLSPSLDRNDEAQNMREAEAIADCMAREGWEYIPSTNPSVQTPVAASDEDEVARIKREGLGIAYSMLTDGTADADEYTVDPNRDYFASLSEDEQAAYNESLQGTEEEQAATMTTVSQFDPYTGAELQVTGSRSGCQGEAQEAYYRERAQAPEAVAAMRGYWDELQDRVGADPRTIKLEAGWASCMKKSGYDYSSQEAFRDATQAEFQRKAAAIVGDDYYRNPTDGWTQDEIDVFLATATADEINATFNAHPELTPDQRRQLEELLGDEVKVALGEHECSKGLDDKAAKIYADVEDQYAREHEAELSALAGSLASGE